MMSASRLVANCLPMMCLAVLAQDAVGGPAPARASPPRTASACLGSAGCELGEAALRRRPGRWRSEARLQRVVGEHAEALDGIVEDALQPRRPAP